MEEFKEVSSITTEEAQALENGLRILARMIVRAIMSETSVQRKILNKVDVEPATLSLKVNPEHQKESLLLDVRDGARLLSVSRSRVYELVHSRQIPSVRLGKRILIPRAPLTRFVEEVASNSMNAEQQF